ncbi:MAG TPA: 50S ribosomal protein L30 [Piscirickettsiaceae bacterium]|nr:50S ribosomal protein L30 [Piscirickettsiaceae bacterium]
MAAKKAPAKATATKKPAAKKVAAKKNTVSVTLIKSFYGRLPSHRATVTGLGLKRINHTVELIDTPEVRGMINKVSYLLKVEG